MRAPLFPTRSSLQPPIGLFSADLDGTLLGNPESTWLFREVWNALSSENRPLLLYNAGRSVTNIQALVESGTLPKPDLVIGTLGTELYDAENEDAADEFKQLFDDGWNRSEVERLVEQIPGVTRQERDGLHPFQSSWLWPRAGHVAVREVGEMLGRAGLKVSVAYSSQRYLEVLPGSGSKGKALEWICRRKEIPLSRVLVAGDTGNDTSMFLLPEVNRLVVDNALPELLASLVGLKKFVSEKVMADGVVDGLRYFGVIARRTSGR